MEFSARGLVLAERTVGEWDKSLTLLCEGIGKMSAWAKGAKRVKSPLLSACSMFTFGSYSFVKKGERVTVTSAQPEETFFGLRGDVRRLALAAYLCELCKTLCAEQQPEDALLSLTLNALYVLSAAKVQEEIVKPAFELRSLAQSGFLPSLESGCMVCGEQGGPMSFSPSAGGILCEKHAGTQRDCAPLSPSVFSAMRYVCTCDAKKLYSFRLPEIPLREFGEMGEAYVKTTLGMQLQTLQFYRLLCDDIRKIEENQ